VDALARRAAASADDLLRAAAAAGFRGSDPYDALWWPHWPRLLVGGNWRRTVLVQLHVRTPVDVRRLYRRRHPMAAKTLGTFGSVAVRLDGLSDDGDDAGAARRHGTAALELLDAERSAGDAAWSYPWHMQTRWSFYAAGLPNIIATVFAARALAEAAEQWDRPDWHERARRAAHWVLDELLQPGGFFAYHPGNSVLVHNANLLGALLVHDLLGEPDAVRRAVERTLDAQRPDGSWPYGDGGKLGFVDNFHTGYNLESLSRMRALDPAIGDAVRTGTSYWLQRFFRPDGTATLWPDRRWPEDAHSTGTAMTAMSELVGAGFVEREHLERTTRYALDRMVDGDHAIARRYRLGRTRVTYIRWCDGHMALGLANAAAVLGAQAARRPVAHG
jgi:hypothetical protein